eukprot:TRINITY_DN2915_c0_g1_i1.p1 TRINITY_DN2915_c0_g1~~TRINITY_DN2915_c0_g1_i1.p1  ORF type:complete len:354 (+),score=64.11 TRINITY_DN2915_c0_g1_i1:239-1300(+)
MEKKEVIALIGDLGGCNTRLQLIKLSVQTVEPETLKLIKYENINYKSFKDIVIEFLKGVENLPIIGTIGCAGPIQPDNSVTLSRAEHWQKICGADFLNDPQFKFKKFKLLNDFEANAYGTLKLQPSDFVKLNEAKGIDNKIKSVIGPGTGLGECMLIPAGDRYYVWPGEGGHSAFSPINELECELMLYLKKQRNLDYICNEVAFAGPVIPYLYKFLQEKMGEKCPEAERINALTNEQEANKEIFIAGLQGKSKVCQKLIDMMIQMLATETSNVSVRTLCYSGIYIVGNIVQALLEYIVKNKDELFMKPFYNKDKMKQVLDNIPIYVVTKQELGLFGNFVEAQRILEDLEKETK